MDFKLVLEKLLASFREQNIRYALIGGFAAGLWGGSRSTVDLDFLVQQDDMHKIDGIMKGLGYECRYRSENVSQYLAPSKVFGEVDFFHAFSSPSLMMLQRIEEKKCFNETLSVNVLTIEDLIAIDEMLQSAVSASLRDDMEYLSSHRHNPTLVDGKVDTDRWLEFLNGFNEFINHEPKPFKPMIDENMKL